jgi:rRNA maturation RNase YbeY
MPVDVCGHQWELAESLARELTEDAESVLLALERSEEELSIALTDDAGIQELNSTWRDKNKATDVLSFPQDLPGLLGDLVISVETAQEQAEQRDHGLRDELRILLVHGVLHLCGHDHERGPEAHREMAEAERGLMRKVGWTGEGLIVLAERGEAGDEASERS